MSRGTEFRKYEVDTIFIYLCHNVILYDAARGPPTDFSQMERSTWHECIPNVKVLLVSIVGVAANSSLHCAFS